MDQQKKIVIVYADQEEDKKVAFEVYYALEEKGLKCWIAPKDIEPGNFSSDAIYKAISKAETVVLILSEHSNNSIYILAEIELAFSNHIRIITLKIKDVEVLPRLNFFIRIYHWENAFEPPRNNAILKIAKKISESTPLPPLPPIQDQPSITHLIKVLFQPFSVALSEIQEQEIKARNIGLLGLNNAIFKLNELFAKFSTLCFLAAYRKNTDQESDSDIDKKIIEILRKSNVRWIKLLEYFTQIFENDTNMPSFLQDFMAYLIHPFQSRKNHESITKAIKTISSGLKVEAASYTTILSFLKLLVRYENDYNYNNGGVKIQDAALQIKNAFLSIFHECTFFKRAKMILVTRRAATQKAFEIESINLMGLKLEEKNDLLFTKDFSILSNHILLFQSDDAQPNIQEHLNLSPFILPTEDQTDLLIWDHTKRFKEVSYKSPGEQVAKEQSVDEADAFFIRLQEAYQGVRSDEEGGLTEEIVTNLLNESREYIVKEVTNPLSQTQYLSKFKEYEEQLENYVSDQQSLSLLQIHNRINQLKKDVDQGVYNKLKPTESAYILTDKYGGRYIIAKNFFETKTIKQYDALFNIIPKKISEEVKLLIFLSYNESISTQKQAVIGVEHLMIALSKVCNKIVFDWYDAIGISQKLHRDLTRLFIKKRSRTTAKQVKNGQWIIKPRLKTVLSMALKESNRAKQEDVNLKDCFSAILREGDSVSIRILLDVFDLTHDRLLGEYYNLLRKTG